MATACIPCQKEPRDFVELLGLLCRLPEGQTVELCGCSDPERVCRLLEIVGARHEKPVKVPDGSWTVRVMPWSRRDAFEGN